jgi:hypothetical protein
MRLATLAIYAAMVVLVLLLSRVAVSTEAFCGGDRECWGRPAGAWPGAFSYGGDTGGTTLGWLPLASLIPPQESSDCTLTGCPRGQACWTDPAGVSQCATLDSLF